MALLEKNTTVDLSNSVTYMQFNSKSSIDLWFLPGITELLGRTDILDGNVKNGRYYLDKELIYSY